LNEVEANKKMPNEVWSKERIESFLSDNRFTYQDVELPYGLRTGGVDRSATARRVFPDDLSGNSVLDIGCMYGYFCFEAEARGASKVVGIDVNLENIGKCQAIADMKGSKCRFLQHDIERDELDEKFDYILCLNVLHHLRNPISALDILLAMTTERLILEIASFSRVDRRKSRVSTMIAPLLDRLPIIYLGDSTIGERKSDVSSQTFFITRRASEALLLGHRRSVARLEYADEGHKGRYTVIVHKRRIEHLVIVAGVPTSGKTTFINQLKSGEVAAVADHIGFDSDREWTPWYYGTAGSCEAAVSNVVLHCNITKHLIDGDIYRYGNALLDMIKVADRVTVVTLWCSPRVLAMRYDAERAGKSTKWHISPWRTRRSRKNRIFSRLFANEYATTALFADWLSFVKRHVGQGAVVMQEEDNRVISIAEWEDRYWSRALSRPISTERGSQIT
jgi:SAM-dependent methyltransferase